MKKHQFLFHKTPIDQHRLDGIDAVIARCVGSPASRCNKGVALK